MIDLCHVNAAGFAVLRGEELRGMNETDFCKIDPIYGREMYREIIQYRRPKTSGEKFTASRSCYCAKHALSNINIGDLSHSSNALSQLNLD